MTYKTSRTAAGIACLTLAVIVLTSCSTEPQTYLMRSDYSPEGMTVKYVLSNQRAGSVFVGDVFKNDFETQATAEITFLTQEALDDSTWLIKEENIWSWDEPVNDSGKVTRKTRKLAYLLTVNSREKILNVEVLDGSNTPGRLKYIESYYTQTMPVFPEEPVEVGYSWTQKTPVTLPDSSSFTGVNVFTVKGTARKKGYNCLIIESKAKAALPVFDNPETEMVGWGVDWIESNELQYFAIDEGIVVHSESKSRLIVEREYTKIVKQKKNDDGELIDIPEKDWYPKEEKIRQEIEETSTYTLENLSRE